MARRHSGLFPTSNGEEVYVGMLCAQWGPRLVRRPDITRLAEAPPFLIVQAEYDHATPLEGAENVRRTYENGYLVIARNLERHGVYGFTRTPCVELSVAHFLLDGTLPAKRTTSCVEESGPRVPEPEPEPAQNHLHDHTEFWRRVRPW